MGRPELQKARRYALSLAVTIFARRQTPAVSRNGRTEDISNRGVYFMSQMNRNPT
jgi:hypothetical protein